MWQICFFINTSNNKTWLGREEAKVTWPLRDKLTWSALECQWPSVGGNSQLQTTPHGMSQQSKYFDITLLSSSSFLPELCTAKSNQKLKGRGTHWCPSKNKVDKGEEGPKETNRRNPAQYWRLFELWPKPLLTSLQPSLTGSLHYGHSKVPNISSSLSCPYFNII